MRFDPGTVRPQPDHAKQEERDHVKANYIWASK